MAKLDFLFGPPDIASLKQHGNTRLLSAALSYQKDAAIRRSAAIALGELRDPAAVPGLLQAMGSETDPGVKLNCIRSLGMIGDKRATEPLLQLIDTHLSELSRVRHDSNIENILDEAFYSLGKICDEKAVPALINLYTNKQYMQFTSQIIATLGKIGSQDAVEFLAAELTSRVQNKPQTIYREDCVRIIKLLGENGSSKIIKMLLSGLSFESEEYLEFFDYCDLLDGKYKLRVLVIINTLKQILEKNCSQLDIEDLAAIASMKNVTYSYVIPEHNQDGSDGWGYREPEKVREERVNKVYDCSLLRNLAQQEYDARQK
jgi:hypothetical protein